ncbi:ESX secretion-associated protein EspG [Actinomycetospora endophytica]|uniref:ESX secretion-associated protein EspG n=1 Tax=Actinomycetospora endophytica TaxID=2291215 RepID=A0ABS8P730_9PSEU|nr:ESX secretion-associated protein EspG [Actinomycetospora endophytica]MCD2194067.1 ESX secretion-associated protein EspG [Actinomycetospora endophytica]
MTAPVPEVPARRLRLDRDAFLAAWRHLRLGDRPPLLDVPDHGATLSARDAADRAALAALQTRGLARTGGPGTPPVPIGDLADALAVLARPEVDVDLRCWDGPSAVARHGYAAVSGQLAVVVEPDADRGGLVLDLASRGASATTPGAAVGVLAAGLLARLPDDPALPGVPMTVPAAALFGDRPVHDLAPAVAHRLAALRADPPRRQMQLGAALYRGAGRHRVGPLTVVDTVAGRIVVEVVGSDAHVVPADRVRIAHEIQRRAGT